MLAALAWPTCAAGQTASQITPPTFAPLQAQPQGPITIPAESGTSAPVGAERVEVMLADVKVEGAAIDPNALQKLRQTIAGRRVKVSDIFAAVRSLEADLVREGQVLTRIVIPAQSLADGATLRLVVVEGVFEKIDTTHLARSIRAKVDAILAPLVGRPGITANQLERRLLLASDVPGVVLRSTLAAGSRPGTVLLIIDAKYRAIGGSASIDSLLARSLGRYEYALGLDFNSTLGLGETVYLRGSGLPNAGRETSVLDPTPRNRSLAAGFILPLGNDGLALNIEGADARTSPRHDATQPGFGSRFRRLSARLRYPVIRARVLTLAIDAQVDAQDERVRIIDPTVLPISLDRLRVVRAGGDLSAYLPGGGAGRVRLRASFGLNALGARSARDASPQLPLSRAGTDANFQKLEASAAIDQPIGTHFGLALRVRAQTSFGQVMANAEQIGIASIDAISPLPSGSFQGDSGFVGRGELRLPFIVPVSKGALQIAPYGFSAYGAVRLQNPSALERRSAQLSAVGGGLRLSGGTGSSNLSASVEYGRAQIEGARHLPSRLFFTVAGQF